MRTIHLLALAVLAAGIVPAAAQDAGGVLKGTVVERSGQPIPGAVVTIVHPERADQVRVTITDSDGKYELSGLDAGVRYAVRVSHPRYRKASLQVRAAEDGGERAVSLRPRRTMLSAQR